MAMMVTLMRSFMRASSFDKDDAVRYATGSMAALGRWTSQKTYQPSSRNWKVQYGSSLRKSLIRNLAKLCPVRSTCMCVDPLLPRSLP